MANKNVCILILIATIVAQATWIQAKDYEVGDDPKGWKLGVDYNQWTAGKEFHLGDRIDFGYQPGQHNLVVVHNKADYDNCCIANAYPSSSCGRNYIVLEHPTTYYLFSSMNQDCQNGMKFTITPMEAPNASPSCPACPADGKQCCP